MKLYVIIVTYNGAKWIEHCLSSVYQSTIEAVPIVLDNGSKDSTLSIIRDKFPQCQLIETGANLGFGRANNLGIREAIKQGAEYIYLLNQDAWVAPDCFEQIVKVHKDNPEYGILSPLQLTGDWRRADKNFVSKIVETADYEQMLTDFLASTPKNVYEVGLVMAAHWMLYVPDLKKIGLFSPAFAHYGEDYNLITRYHYYGKKVGICSYAKACHDREFRPTPPEKKIRITYLVFLRLLHDPNRNAEQRCFDFLHLFNRVLKIKNVSLKLRCHYLVEWIKEYSRSRVYRDIYTNEDCYHLLQNMEL